jgi:hypothetical protein
MVQGSDRFVRHEWSDVQKFRDGLIPDEDGQAPLTTAMRKVAPPSWWSSTLRRKVWPTTSYMDSVRATPFFGLIAVRDRYDLEQSLCAGRIWQRAHLLATARNVAGQPLNQIVELVDHQRSLNQQPQAIAEIAELIGDTDWQPTFMFLFGYPIREAGPSPRRGIQACLLQSTRSFGTGVSGQTKLPRITKIGEAKCQKGSKEKLACSLPDSGRFLGPRFCGVRGRWASLSNARANSAEPSGRPL